MKTYSLTLCLIVALAATTGHAAIATFDAVGDFNAQFNPDDQYSVATSGGLNDSRAVVMANTSPASFDGTGSESVDFSVDGASVAVGAFFKLNAIPTDGEVLRLGLTEGGSDDFSNFPYAVFERNPIGGANDFRFQYRGQDVAGDFELLAGEWYYFEAIFTNVVDTPSESTSLVTYDMAMYQATSNGLVGGLLDRQVADRDGGITQSFFTTTMYGGFKGHTAFDNAGSGVMDNFYVDSSGVSLIPEPSSLALLATTALFLTSRRSRGKRQHG